MPSRGARGRSVQLRPSIRETQYHVRVRQAAAVAGRGRGDRAERPAARAARAPPDARRDDRPGGPTSRIGTLAAGDIKLFLAIGLLTGWFSWLLPLYALVAGYILAIPHAGILLARRRRTPDADTHLPFGPYLVAAALLVTIAAKLAG